MKEGDIYIVQMFNAKTYLGDETNRPIRNDRHIYFTNETTMEKDVTPGLEIPITALISTIWNNVRP